MLLFVPQVDGDGKRYGGDEESFHGERKQETSLGVEQEEGTRQRKKTEIVV